MVLTGGKSSILLTAWDDASGISAPLGDGEQLVQENPTRREGIAAYEQSLDKNKDSMLKALLARALENADDGGAPIRIVALSGFYYAALAAKLIKEGATVYQYLKASKVSQRLEKMRDSKESKPAEVAAAARFLWFLHSLFAAHLDKVMMHTSSISMRRTPAHTTHLETH